MGAETKMKDDRIELYYLSIVAISAAVDLIATVYFLSEGISIVFQNIYYFTIVLAAYRYRWRGAYFSIILSMSYLVIFAFYCPEFSLLIQATVRAIIFVSIGFVVAFLSNELLEEKKRYKTIFSASGSGMIVVIGNDHTIVESNSRFSELFGEQATISRRIDAYFERNDIDRAIESINDGEELKGTEMVMTLQTGERRICVVTIGRLNLDELVLSIVDITERKMMETRLREANRKLATLSSISGHDTKNQLTVISGHLELMALRHKEEDVMKSVERMKLAINNIEKQIAFAKDYQVLGGIAPEWFKVSQLLNDAFTVLRPENVKVENAGNDYEVLADPMISKAFYNLVENSIRHGGKVSEIRLTTVKKSYELVIIYEDNGCGISIEDKPKLFQRGFGKNTGLGLFFIKEILYSTGITIMENGEPGKGARFEITVPAGAWRSPRNK